MLTGIWWFMALSVFVLGLCIGSFLNVCVWRLPQGESLALPGSHCPKCKTPIRCWQNIPLLSWLLLRGRCAHCSQSISIRYPLVELTTGLVFALIWHRIWVARLPFGTMPGYLFLAAALIAVTLIDLEHLIIPDKITLPGMAVALVLALLLPNGHFSAGVGVAGEYRVSMWLAESLGRYLPSLVGNRRLLAGFDALLGAAAGFVLLWTVREAGKRVWGWRTYRRSLPLEAVLDPQGVRVGQEFEASWQDVFLRASDRFTAAASGIEIQAREGAPAGTAGPVAEAARITVGRDGLDIGGTQLTWDRVGSIRANLTRWSVPREVMGFGDLKLLAMIGAFLGPDACIFVLLMASLIGCVIGTAVILISPHRHHHQIPFGPFLALGTFAWMLAGKDLVALYGSLLMRFLR